MGEGITTAELTEVEGLKLDSPEKPTPNRTAKAGNARSGFHEISALPFNSLAQRAVSRETPAYLKPAWSLSFRVVIVFDQMRAGSRRANRNCHASSCRRLGRVRWPYAAASKKRLSSFLRFAISTANRAEKA